MIDYKKVIHVSVLPKVQVNSPLREFSVLAKEIESLVVKLSGEILLQGSVETPNNPKSPTNHPYYM